VALLAAESDAGREQIAFVNAFGAYYDATELLRAVASHTVLVDGRLIPWEPSELTVWVFMRQIIASLPDERDRDILTRAFLDKQPEAQAELEQLSPDGRLVVELFRQPSHERVDQIIAALPPATRERLRSISPSQRIDRLRAALYLMHDRSDSYIPFTHSRQLVAAAPPGTVRTYTEFDLFAHVMPDRPLEGLDFAREVLKLYRHAWLFCQEFLWGLGVESWGVGMVRGTVCALSAAESREISPSPNSQPPTPYNGGVCATWWRSSWPAGRASGCRSCRRNGRSRPCRSLGSTASSISRSPTASIRASTTWPF
jgi:hypothetical protein